MRRSIKQRNHEVTAQIVLFALAGAMVSFLVLFAGCSSNNPVAGTGSQSGNARIVCVVYRNSAPASGAIVRLRSHDFTADTTGAVRKTATVSNRDLLTDAQGAFHIDSVTAGRYFIEVNDGNAHAVLLACTVDSGDTAVRLPADTLRPTATIQGSFASAPEKSVTLYIQLYGLERMAVRDPETGEFVINDVPAGSHTLRCVASSADYAPVEIPDVVTLPASMVNVDNIDFVHRSRWGYTRRLLLNTSPDGADIGGTVTDFPVLVRLHAAIFDFATARSDGSDIRFTKANGILLPYCIERWDAAASHAEIWVNVDTVYGNNSRQFITMYWGNSNAGDSSSVWAVFDTARGYRGVWHLGEDETAIHDATANRYSGVKNGTRSRVAGAIGFAQSFRASGDYAEMGNVCDPDSLDFTICAWIRNSGVNRIQTIVSKSGGGSANATYGWLLQLDADGAMAIYMATGTGAWGDPGTFVLTSNEWITDSDWHHVAAVINRSGGSDCRVYIDGEDVSTLPTAGDITNIGRVINSHPLRLGADAQGNYQWDGDLDAVSISYGACTRDRIRLSYLNQQRDDALVTFDGVVVLCTQ